MSLLVGDSGRTLRAPAGGSRALLRQLTAGWLTQSAGFTFSEIVTKSAQEVGMGEKKEGNLSTNVNRSICEPH